ncbi:ABC transporter permease [Caminibacter mediatlanticus]|uniref:ABC-type spermidine/putrescine transport system, permease component I n=1 Tax=Caminibacter mediatlanticus TB-2 TaxID=391592 RepID=A0AAI9AGR9_9BACT|nr:ABC transporter permease [Caminibacter mediatlanticus]EDM23320.1 ABC-type spermidine/putrescine transport system, permease component I [Caminibacter mediatlanticus TB-2]
MTSKSTNLIKFYALILFIWIFGLIILPHLGLLYSSFHSDEVFTLSNYIEFFKHKIYINTLTYTFFNGILVTFLAFIFAVPLAFFLVKMIKKKTANFLIFILLIPLGVGELIVVYGWMISLNDNGIVNYILNLFGINIKILNTPFSMILGFVYMSIIFMLLPIMQSLENLDNSYIEAALDLGANKFDIFTKIIIPFTLPGIVSGSIMVFSLVIGDFLIPNLLGGKSALWFTEIIYDDFLMTMNWSEGSAFGFILLLTTLLVIWIFLKLTKQEFTKVIK